MHPYEFLAVVQVDSGGGPLHLDVFRDWEGLLAARVASEDFGPFDGWSDVARAFLKASRITRPASHG